MHEIQDLLKEPHTIISGTIKQWWYIELGDGRFIGRCPATVDELHSLFECNCYSSGYCVIWKLKP